MNAFGFIRGAVKLVTYTGAGMVVGNIINALSPTDKANILQKVAMAAGGLALAGAASTIASDFVDDQFDEIEEMLNGNKEITEK